MKREWFGNSIINIFFHMMQPVELVKFANWLRIGDLPNELFSERKSRKILRFFKRAVNFISLTVGKFYLNLIRRFT